MNYEAPNVSIPEAGEPCSEGLAINLLVREQYSGGVSGRAQVPPLHKCWQNKIVRSGVRHMGFEASDLSSQCNSASQ